MRFILPRVLALTAIVGLAALVLSLLFKVLVGATIIMAIAFAIRRSFRRHGHNHMPYGPMHMSGNEYSGRTFGGGNTVFPFRNQWQQAAFNQQPSGITPIN